MSSKTSLYAIPKGHESVIYLQGTPPQTNKLFSYHLNRCRGKPHSCGETAIGEDGIFWPSYIHPVGARCGLKNRDTVVEWKYTGTPFSKEPSRMDVDLPEKESMRDKVVLTWNNYARGSLPQRERPFHYTLADCDDPHKTCGIAERAVDGTVDVTLPACSIECPSIVDSLEAYVTFDQWSYLKQ